MSLDRRPTWRPLKALQPEPKPLASADGGRPGQELGPVPVRSPGLPRLGPDGAGSGPPGFAPADRASAPVGSVRCCGPCSARGQTFQSLRRLGGTEEGDEPQSKARYTLPPGCVANFHETGSVRARATRVFGPSAGRTGGPVALNPEATPAVGLESGCPPGRWRSGRPQGGRSVVELDRMSRRSEEPGSGFSRPVRLAWKVGPRHAWTPRDWRLSVFQLTSMISWPLVEDQRSASGCLPGTPRPTASPGPSPVALAEALLDGLDGPAITPSGGGCSGVGPAVIFASITLASRLSDAPRLGLESPPGPSPLAVGPHAPCLGGEVGVLDSPAGLP